MKTNFLKLKYPNMYTEYAEELKRTNTFILLILFILCHECMHLFLWYSLQSRISGIHRSLIITCVLCLFILFIFISFHRSKTAIVWRQCSIGNSCSVRVFLRILWANIILVQRGTSGLRLKATLEILWKPLAQRPVACENLPCSHNST